MKKKPFRTVLALILVVSLFPALLLMTNHIPGVAAAQSAVSTVGKNPANLADAFQISTVTTEAELNEAIQASLGKTTVILGADIQLTQTLTIEQGKEIILTDDGTKRTLSGDGSIQQLVKIDSDASLTIKTSDPANNNLFILDGSNVYSPRGGFEYDPFGGIIHCNGTFFMEGGAIQNYDANRFRGAAIAVVGENASFQMTGGRISDNTFSDQMGGIIYIARGASMTMEDGEICDNDAMPGGQINNGVIFVEADKGEKNTSAAPVTSRFYLKGGIISGNHSCYGTVLLGFPVGYQMDFYSRAVMEMSGGEIINNTADYTGGGIFVAGQAQLKMTGGKIIGNQAAIGGGVSVFDFWRGIGDAMGTTYENWKSWFPAEFVLEGGTISGNHALQSDKYNDGGCGGGIYVASDNVRLYNGNITNNRADRQGGGVYVGSTPYVLHMYDALITENTATILGGGLWFCPTGDATNAVTNGGAIFGNTVGKDGAGDDFVAVPKDNHTHFVTLADRMLGGGEVHWYLDGGVQSTTPEAGGNVLGIPDGTARYDSSNPGDRQTGIQDYTGGIALKAIVNSAASSLANSQAKLRITGNTSTRGGGVGANGGVVIGTPQDEWSLKVTKAWNGIDDANKKPVTIRLKIGEYLLDTVTLEEKNNWTATFDQLPNPDTLGTFSITVVEEGNEYQVSYSETTKDQENKILFITVTNAPPFIPDTSSSPGVSSSPSVSSEPSMSSDPSVSSEPDVSSNPSTSSEPGVSSDPSASSDPGVSSNPSTFSDHGVSSSPSISSDPGASSSFCSSTNTGTSSDSGTSSKPLLPIEPNIPDDPLTGGRIPVSNCIAFMIFAISGIALSAIFKKTHKR